MCDSAYITSVVENPILVIQFRQDADAGMVFCADIDDSNQIRGVSLFYIRKSSQMVERTKQDIIHSIFKPRLVHDSKSGVYRLSLRPLTQPILVTARNGKFVSQYKFIEHGKIGKLVGVMVDAQRSPLKVTFSINATFRQSKDTAPESLVDTVIAPPAFSQELYDLFTG